MVKIDIHKFDKFPRGYVVGNDSFFFARSPSLSTGTQGIKSFVSPNFAYRLCTCKTDQNIITLQTKVLCVHSCLDTLEMYRHQSILADKDQRPRYIALLLCLIKIGVEVTSSTKIRIVAAALSRHFPPAIICLKSNQNAPSIFHPIIVVHQLQQRNDWICRLSSATTLFVRV